MKLFAMEKDRTDTLLGIQFWDGLTNRIISKGLEATAQRLSSSTKTRVGKVVTGWATPSGVIAFSGLTLEEKPLPDDQRPPWSPVAEIQEVVIHVTDHLRRFLPMSFTVRFPSRGAYKGEDISDLRGALPKSMGINLWSLATRTVPPGSAVIRSRIVMGKGNDQAPAAYALVRVRSAGSTPNPTFDYYGMADKRGILSLLMPYPVPEDTNQPPSLAQQTFPLTIEVFYKRDRSQLPPLSLNSVEKVSVNDQPHVDSEVPDLRALLTQKKALIIGTDKQNNEISSQSLDIELKFEEPFILASPNPNSRELVLRVKPAS